MNSGTITKKPAMKLRRSQDMRLHPAGHGCDDDRHAEGDPVPRKRTETRTTNVIEKRPDDRRRRQKRHHEPDGHFDARAPTRARDAPRRARARTPPPSSASRERTRTPPRRRDRRASTSRRRSCRPTARCRESAPASATRRRPSARPTGRLSTSNTSGCGRVRSTTSITMPPMMNAAAITRRLP